uniref:Leucine rich repeat containing 18a n=1 Tax=Cyprinodon variegatus TaxID=28743 RepID=A0A3Q2DP48_CYPVA
MCVNKSQFYLEKGPKFIETTWKKMKQLKITMDGSYRLTLSKMRLTTAPRCLNLIQVSELNLSRNYIKRLPDDIGRLTSLKWLDLHTNKLESVPESIGKLVGLTHLNLSDNCLNSDGLPSSLGFLCNLKTLNLGQNQLNSLPPTLERLDQLQELSLFDNLFTKVPDFVEKMGNLTKLNLRGNPLTSAQANTEKTKSEKTEQEDKLVWHLVGKCQNASKFQIFKLILNFKSSLPVSSFAPL